MVKEQGSPAPKPEKPPSPDGWTEWGKHVLLELERNDKDHGNFGEKLNKLVVDVALLKMKAGIWGAVGASIPILIGFIIWLLTKGSPAAKP